MKSKIKDRVKSEKEQLIIKGDKLACLINSPKFLKLSKIQKELLKIQLTIMTSYVCILDSRLKNWELE